VLSQRTARSTASSHQITFSALIQSSAALRGSTHAARSDGAWAIYTAESCLLNIHGSGSRPERVYFFFFLSLSLFLFCERRRRDCRWTHLLRHFVTDRSVRNDLSASAVNMLMPPGTRFHFVASQIRQYNRASFCWKALFLYIVRIKEENNRRRRNSLSCLKLRLTLPSNAMYCGKINRAVCAKGTAGAGEGGSPLLPPSRSYCNLALENTIVGTSPVPERRLFALLSSFSCSIFLSQDFLPLSRRRQSATMRKERRRNDAIKQESLSSYYRFRPSFSNV